VTREKLIEAIKIHKSTQETSQKETDSVSDNMKTIAYELIEKMESKIPSYVKLYSDLYKKYLEIMKSFANVYCSNQKQFLTNMEVNEDTLDAIDVCLKYAKQFALYQMEINENIFKTYFGYRFTMLDFYNNMINGSIFDFA